MYYFCSKKAIDIMRKKEMNMPIFPAAYKVRMDTTHHHHRSSFLVSLQRHCSAMYPESVCRLTKHTISNI